MFVRRLVPGEVHRVPAPQASESDVVPLHWDWLWDRDDHRCDAPRLTHAAGSVDVAAQPSPGGAVVGNGQIRGDFAFAAFRSHATDPSDPPRTLFTHVIVAVNMDQTQAPGGGWQSAPGIRVAIFVDGIRAGENSTTPVLHVESGSDAGYANLALDYGATRDLGAATLYGVFAGTNMLMGQPVEVAADLAWNATGEVVESKDHIHNVDPRSFIGIVHAT